MNNSKKMNVILKNALVISPQNNINRVVDIEIQDGIITKIENTLQNKHNLEEIDLSAKIITPGLVEMHCHLREPGFEEKETIKTGIQSALAGGYTAICPMANTMPVNDNPDTLIYINQKVKEAGRQIDVLPICAVTMNLAGEEIVDFQTLKAYGAIAFSNDGKPIEQMSVLKRALLKAAESDVLVISHAESSDYSPYDNKSEYAAVLRELEIVKETDSRYHFAHISTSESAGLIKEAKDEGWNVTCETAPHYFSLSKEDIENEHARFKMNPPLRSKEDVEAIKDGLMDGTIDVIATDHAPHTLKEKNLPFDKAPMGIVGFETAFSLAYQNLVQTGILTLPSLVRKFSTNPSQILNLENQGVIEIGKPANLMIFDPEKEWTVQAENFESKCKITPFEGHKLKGKVIATIAKGIKYGN